MLSFKLNAIGRVHPPFFVSLPALKAPAGKWEEIVSEEHSFDLAQGRALRLPIDREIVWRE
jgi:hypothetical protein